MKTEEKSAQSVLIRENPRYAFGEQLKVWDAIGDNTDDKAKYSYGGKELDDDTNLYYFNARYYDATIGRFINVDMIQDGTNWYVYCGNNPTNRADPTGLAEVKEEGVRFNEESDALKDWAGEAGYDWEKSDNLSWENALKHGTFIDDAGNDKTDYVKSLYNDDGKWICGKDDGLEGITLLKSEYYLVDRKEGGKNEQGYVEVFMFHEEYIQIHSKDINKSNVETKNITHPNGNKEVKDVPYRGTAYVGFEFHYNKKGEVNFVNALLMDLYRNVSGSK